MQINLKERPFWLIKKTYGAIVAHEVLRVTPLLIMCKGRYATERLARLSSIVLATFSTREELDKAFDDLKAASGFTAAVEAINAARKTYDTAVKRLTTLGHETYPDAANGGDIQIIKEPK